MPYQFDFQKLHFQWSVCCRRQYKSFSSNDEDCITQLNNKQSKCCTVFVNTLAAGDLTPNGAAPLTHWRRDKIAARLADDRFKCIFLNEDVWISIRISLTSVPEVPIHNKPALVQIMAWRLTGDKPLSEPMMAYFTDAYIYVSLGLNELTDTHNENHNLDLFCRHFSW